MRNNKLEKIVISKAAKWLVDSAKEQGIDIDGLDHIITEHFVNHVLKEHGDPEKEKARGQVAVSNDDFEKITDVVNNPDFVMIGAKREGKHVFYYCKKISDGTIIYVENVFNNDIKGLLGKTMLKRKKDMNEIKFKNIVSMNIRTDISKAKIVNPVGTGGNPSCANVAANPTQPSGLLSNNNITQNK